MPASGARAMIVVAVDGSGDPIEAQAIDLETPVDRLSIPLSRSGDLGVFALAYGCSLARLDLAPGRLPLDTPGRADRAPLPPGARVLVAAPNPGGERAEWSAPGAALAERVSSFRLARPPRGCRPVTWAPVELPGTRGGHAVFLADAGEGRVLAGTASGAFFLVGRTGAERVPGPPGGSRAYGAAKVSPAGDEMWLLAEGNRVFRGHPKTGWTLTSTMPGPEPSELADVATPGDPAANPGDVLVFTDRRSIALRSGGEWTLLEDGQPFAIGRQHGATWVAPDRWLVVRKLDRAAVWIEGRRLEYERPFPEMEKGTSVGRVPGVGVIAGTDDGSLFTAPQLGRWRKLESNLNLVPVEFILPFPEGMLWGGDMGVVGRKEGEVLCPPETVLKDSVGAHAGSGRYAYISRHNGAADRNIEVWTVEAPAAETPCPTPP